MSLTATIAIGAVILFGVILIFVMLNDHFGWDLISDDYDEPSTTSKSNSVDYQHKDFWGVPGGKASYSGNKATHTDSFLQ